MPRAIEIVVVGGSGLIGKRHLQHVAKSLSAIIFGIIDPSPAAIDLSASYSVPLFASVEELLKQSKRPDAAIVCTPNRTHVPLSLDLVSAGIHVLVEKPISISVSSGQSLIDTAKKQNVRVLVGHHRRFNPYVLAAKEALDSNVIGDITAVSALWTVFKPQSYFDPEALRWRSSKQDGGGVVLINMIHEIDLMHYLFGTVTRVHAEKSVTRRRTTPAEQADAEEEGAAITLRFKSGVVGTFIISDHVGFPHNFEFGTGENPMIHKIGADVYRFFGTRGTLSFPDMVTWSYGDDSPSWELKLKQEILDVP
ncbi:putative quinate utilization oxidoreductase [Phaeomoniella chlamydospora]|uniref:Putative quinate utilization oxidoreductase n=1 Tax=Phaeomoniella chlamydospora TaxID=158046 RepID=A0A0G2GKW4_PHACM|nr:putative quinate utilization oxidoreductase [Phaeomoniella chlamydospora]